MVDTTDAQFENLIEQRIRESVSVHSELLGQVAPLAEVVGVLVRAYRAGNKAVFFGNGGSAADAQHLAAELVGRFYLERNPLPALALTVNSSALTAVGNDYSFDLLFARQIEALCTAGDVAIGISTSGNSRNVIEGIRAARRKGMHTVALTGVDGGNVKAEADLCIRVPSRDTPRIQEGHILIGHILCELVERALYAP